MADSSNMLDLHHQAEELLLLHGSSALEFCNQDPLSYPGAFIPSINTTLTCPKDDILIDPFFGSHMVHDPGLQYAAGAESFTHLAKIKEELFDSSKLDETHQFSFSMKHEEQTLLSEFKRCQPSLPFDGDLGRDPSTVLQSANFPSSFLPSAAALQTSSNMDLQALELFSSVQLSDICRPPTFLADMYSSPPQGSSIGLHKMPASSHGVADARRPATGSLHQLKTSQGAAKKPRMESRSAVSPFKVRKEKLGDRIAALQQLVAPFGKTDTASVLMEAIGYIKFLQDQVETLSVPYMRSSSNTKSRKTEQASNEEGDDPKPDLRSRGLCLVPLACTTYVTNDSAVWLPPNFRGST